MTWFWSDDLARLLIERDGVPPQRVAAWISGPAAHRSDLGALELARQLLAEEDGHIDDAADRASSAA